MKMNLYYTNVVSKRSKQRFVIYKYGRFLRLIEISSDFLSFQIFVKKQENYIFAPLRYNNKK